MENLIKETEIKIEDYFDFKKLLETYGTSKESAVIIEQIDEKIKELQIRLAAFREAKVIADQNVPDYFNIPHYKDNGWKDLDLNRVTCID